MPILVLVTTMIPEERLPLVLTRPESHMDIVINISVKKTMFLTSTVCPVMLLMSLVGSFTTHHYSDVILSAMASQIASVSIVYSTVCSGADQREHQSFASLAFVMGIYRWPVDSPHNGPVIQKMFPFDDVIIWPHSNLINNISLLTANWITASVEFISIKNATSKYIKLSKFVKKVWIPAYHNILIFVMFVQYFNE